MQKMYALGIVFILAACGNGDTGEGYHSTDTSELNQTARNELNNITPVGDSSDRIAPDSPLNNVTPFTTDSTTLPDTVRKMK